MSKRMILFIDSGDTLIDESTEVRLVPGGVVQTARCVPFAYEALKRIHDEGYTIALVADGLEESFKRILGENGLWDMFSAYAISEIVGHEKPHEAMFRKAMNDLGLDDTDKKRILMVGNNIKRDITGANRFGIHSALLTWSPRYNMIPENAEETPEYTLASMEKLPDLLQKLERDDLIQR